MIQLQIVFITATENHVSFQDLLPFSGVLTIKQEVLSTHQASPHEVIFLYHFVADISRDLIPLEITLQSLKTYRMENYLLLMFPHHTLMHLPDFITHPKRLFFLYIPAL